MLKGWILLSTDPEYCYQMSMNSTTKIITLDEENTYQELDPDINSNVIHGTVLLPGPEVLWAEIDGDEYRFNSLYYEQLMRPDIVEFIYTIIGYVYKGGNIIIYTESINPSIKYLIDFFERAYGIHVATSENNPYRFDPSCIPMYCIGVYSLGIMDPYEFLSLFPKDAEIPKDIYTKLIIDINPYSSLNNYYEKIDAINLIRSNIGNNHLSRNAIKCIG